MRNLFALGICLALVGSAFADFVVTGAGPYDSAGPLGDAGNAVFSQQYTGADTFFGSMTFAGDLTEVNTGTYASEARWNVRNELFTGGINYQMTSTGNFDGTIHIDAAFAGLLVWANMNDNFRFEAYESYDDSGLDAQWTNINFNFADFTGAITDLGTFAAGDFDINTIDSTFDTELALYTATGTMLATNDDIGGGPLQSQILTNLGDGTYYVLLGGYNSQFVDGLALAGTAAGDYILNVNDVQMTGALGASEFGVFSFTIPEPATLTLFALGLLGLVRRR